LTEGSVCGDKREFDISSGRDLYKLINQNEYSGCNTEIGGVKQDPRYFSIATVSE